ncbi:hypothetical protein KP79_PYT25556 [Mizuhopecten yessoensis]|uniref:Uncharacterized protein n=1 Tax=Mizuhopecten yessoensis TaxID=6573 RepID=A0A210QTR5_MIZYE|nr:hypothetical protein KP79_PYT25556 [Mizuhopecten yessoensis]
MAMKCKSGSIIEFVDELQKQLAPFAKCYTGSGCQLDDPKNKERTMMMVSLSVLMLRTGAHDIDTQ